MFQVGARYQKGWEGSLQLREEQLHDVTELFTEKDRGPTLAGGVAALHASFPAQVFLGTCCLLSDFRSVLDSRARGGAQAQAPPRVPESQSPPGP